jgi:exopolysaccharide biosynthesis polyprenyl glycosylphosphotransferase
MISKILALSNKTPESASFSDTDFSFIADEKLFNYLLSLERKRTERTGDPFVLMLLDVTGLHGSALAHKSPEICAAIRLETRDTDSCGWYKFGSAIGVIFTHLRKSERSAIQCALTTKTDRALATVLGLQDLEKVNVSFHFFPEIVDVAKPTFKSDEKLYPDLSQKEKARSLNNLAKRILDIVGSLLFLFLFSPLLPLIWMLIKFTSKGPVLFRQRRVGRFGKEFDFLKFRTMYEDADHKIHEFFVRDLIENRNIATPLVGNSKPVYKITNDPRITAIGRFLRKSSLDEVPQFINVLKGEMSLVGPRPPIPYELAAYRFWHRRRVLEVKPGITGLWQVHGRSSTTFDEMVRLDLRYIREQSFWLDIKILLKTPRAILSGRGAY